MSFESPSFSIFPTVERRSPSPLPEERSEPSSPAQEVFSTPLPTPKTRLKGPPPAKTSPIDLGVVIINGTTYKATGKNWAKMSEDEAKKALLSVVETFTNGCEESLDNVTVRIRPDQILEVRDQNQQLIAAFKNKTTQAVQQLGTGTAEELTQIKIQFIKQTLLN